MICIEKGIRYYIIIKYIALAIDSFLHQMAWDAKASCVSIQLQGSDECQKVLVPAAKYVIY